MKTAYDPRHLKRITAVQEIFAWNFQSRGGVNQAEEQVKSSLSKGVLSNLDTIDGEIKAAASEYPLEHINKIDLAILRLAVYELLVEKLSFKVVVDEAVEIGKELGSDSSPKFINGVLGKIITLHKLDEEINKQSLKPGV